MSILVMAFKVLLVVIMVGIDHFIDCQEVEEKLIISKRRLISEHDQRTDNVYAEILMDDDDNDIEQIKQYEIKQIKSKLQNIDKNNNNYIEKQELVSRLFEVYKKLSTHEADLEFHTKDINGDDYVTWQEYVDETYALNEQIDEENEEKEIFLAADLDKDNKLSKIEFQYFYIPEDYPFMKSVLIAGVMKRFDINKDNKITFDEFIENRKLNHNNQFLQEENIKFTKELDINKDGILDENEIYIWAIPNNKLIAENEAENLIFKSDKNKDDMLSYEEFIDGYLIHMSSDNDENYIFKDEL